MFSLLLNISASHFNLSYTLCLFKKKEMIIIIQNNPPKKRDDNYLFHKTNLTQKKTGNHAKFN